MNKIIPLDPPIDTRLLDAETKVLWDNIQLDPELAAQSQIILEGQPFYSPEFLGFVHIYRALAEIIPPHWWIYDLGCGFSFQSWYFRNHAGYVGVDTDNTPIDCRLCPPNAIHIQSTIEEFVQSNHHEPNSFAICNYVPPWHGGSGEIVRRHFENCFVYYPSLIEVKK